jgi:hypothetical protein
MRPLGAIVLYVIAGTALTLFVYRIVLEGAFAPAGQERTIDGLIIFISIVLNLALAFAAAAVAGVMVARAGWPFVAVLVLSIVVTAVIGAGMALWFRGIGGAFPVVMALNGGLCAVLADRLGLLHPSALRKD